MREAGAEGVPRLLLGFGACVVERQPPRRSGSLEDLPVERFELVELAVEVEIRLGVLACGAAHAGTQLWVLSEPRDGDREFDRIAPRHDEARDAVHDVLAEAARVRADDRKPHRLCLGDGDSERLGERRVHQDIGPGIELAHLARRKRAEQLHALCDAEVADRELRRLALVALADDPVVDREALCRSGA